MKKLLIGCALFMLIFVGCERKSDNSSGKNGKVIEVKQVGTLIEIIDTTEYSMKRCSVKTTEGDFIVEGLISGIKDEKVKIVHYENSKGKKHHKNG